MRVSVVIPNWNGAPLLGSLLSDLKSQTEQPVEVLILDNGSTDDSAAIAASHGAEFIALGENFGFAAAVNEGVNRSKAPAVAILNNDVRLPQHTWLAELMGALKRDQSAFACGKLLNEVDPNWVDGTYDVMCRGGAAWRCGSGRKDGPLWDRPAIVSFAPFTALLIWRNVFLELGGLDDAYGSYLEDVDFGLRCASNGYKGSYQPTAFALHQGSATWGRWNARTVRQIARNQILLLARHYPSSLLLRFGWKIAIAHLLWGLVALKHGAGLAWLSGKIDGLRAWGANRRKSTPAAAQILGSSERELLHLQKASGFDSYWHWYFLLTCPWQLWRSARCNSES